MFRVLRPGGVFIVSFSNRLFYEKAIAAWRDGTGYSRVQLVVQYFQCVEGFTQPQVIRKLPNAKQGNSIFSQIAGVFGLLSGSDPFYAVIAYKNFKPIYEWHLHYTYIFMYCCLLVFGAIAPKVVLVCNFIFWAKQFRLTKRKLWLQYDFMIGRLTLNFTSLKLKEVSTQYAK